MEHDEVYAICQEMMEEQLQGWRRTMPSDEVVYWFANVCESAGLSEDQVRKLFQHMINNCSRYLDSIPYKRIRILACQLRHFRYIQLWQKGMLESVENCDELRRALWQERRGVFEPLIPTPLELELDPFWGLDALGSEKTRSNNVVRFKVDLPVNFTVSLKRNQIGIVIIETENHEFDVRFWRHWDHPEWWDIRVTGGYERENVIAVGRDLADLEARDRGDFFGYLNPGTIGFPQWGTVEDFLIELGQYQMRLYLHPSQEKVTVLISEPTGDVRSSTSLLADQLLGPLLGSMDPGLQEVALKLIDDDEE